MDNNQFLQKLISMQRSNQPSNSLIKNVNVFLDVVDPVLVSYEDVNGVHVLYLIEHKRIKKTYTFLKIETNYEVLEDILNQRKPLSNVFSKNMKKVYLNLKKRFTRYSDINLSEAIDKNFIPEETFYLDKKYPNRINLNDAKVTVSVLRKNFEYKNKYFENIDFKNLDLVDEVENYLHDDDKIMDNDFKGYKKRKVNKYNENRTEKVQTQLFNI